MRGRVLGVLAATVVIAAASLALSAGTASADEGVVERIVDGDTLKVRINGAVETIRLLNVDAPETKHPDKDVECLGPEAADRLKMLLPVGSTVTLKYDRERTDRYGRTLAAVFDEDESLVNAEVARLGLGAAVVYGSNDRFLPAVRSAQAEAAKERRGLHSDEVACTVSGQVAALGQTVAAAQVPITELSTMSLGELGSAVTTAAALVVTADALADLFSTDRIGVSWLVLSSVQRDSLGAKARQHGTQARQDMYLVESVHSKAVAREASAARAAAEAEAARLAEEAAASERAAAAAKAPRVSRPAAKPPAGNPYPGYTGPRCYASGGKTWKPC